MTDYAHHYKDREPEETIKIITEFFIKRGFELHLIQDIQSEINTYSCTYHLYYKDMLLLTANGKGMSRDYCIASCLGELYERFCGEALSNINNPFLSKDVSETRKKIKGYYYHLQEKEITIDELLQDENVKYYLNKILPDNSYIQDYMLINYNQEKIYGLKYQNLKNNNDIKYKNFQLLHQQLGANGMACGNTLEEALVQGCSEIYERIVINKFYAEPQEIYYYLNNNIFTQEIQDILKQLEEKKYKIKIYDLSYNFNLPVCMIYLFNKENNNFYINFGASPIFNIAVERCLTELYQGILSFKNYNMPIKYTSKIDNNLSYACISQWISGKPNQINYFNKNLFINSKEINQYNSNIFINDVNVNNKNIIQKINQYNINLYWTDISLDDKIKTVHIVTDDLTNIISLSYSLRDYNKFTNNNKIFYITLMKKIYKLIKQHIINGIEQKDIQQIFFYCNNICNTPLIKALNMNEILFNYIFTLFHPIRCKKYIRFKESLPTDFNNFFILYNNENNNDILFNFYDIYYKRYQNYIFQQEGLDEQTLKELQQNYKIENTETLFKYIYMDGIKENYTSNYYHNFVLGLI